MKYNPHLDPAEMSYFRLNLLSYLRDAHPDKANDLSFIAARGDMAAEAYSQAIKAGLDHIQAAEIANEILFKGLPPHTICLSKSFGMSFTTKFLPVKRKRKREYCYPNVRQYLPNTT